MHFGLDRLHRGLTTKKPTKDRRLLLQCQDAVLRQLTARSVVNASSSSLCAFYSACNILADAANGVAARAQGNEGDEDSGSCCEETCGHMETPLNVCA